jgi:hypothetical protein
MQFHFPLPLVQIIKEKFLFGKVIKIYHIFQKFLPHNFIILKFLMEEDKFEFEHLLSVLEHQATIWDLRNCGGTEVLDSLPF